MRRGVPAALHSYVGKIRSFSTNAKLFLLSSALGSVQSGIFQVVLALYVVALGHARDFLGVMTGFGALVTGIVSLPAAAVARATGHRKALLAGAALSALGALGIAVSSSRDVLLLFEACLGAGTAFTFVNTAPFLAENSGDAERAYLFSVNSTMLLAVAVVGNSLGGVLPDIFGGLAPGWNPSGMAPLRATMMVGVVFVAASAAPLMALKEWSSREVREDASRLPDGSRSRTKAYLVVMGRFVTTSVVTSLGAGLMIPFLPVFLADKGASPPVIGLVFAGSMVMTMAGTLVAPLLAERWGSVKTVVVTQIASVPFLVAMALAQDIEVIVPAMLLRSALMNMSGPVDSSFSMEAVSARDRAILSSLRGMAWNLSWAGGSVAGGIMIERFGYAVPFLMTATLYLASAIMYVLFFSKLELRQSRMAGDYPRPRSVGR
ncbi:MAG: MFS transporter [Betaproteobacteria bacterium]